MALDCLLIFPYFLKYDPTQRKRQGPFPHLGLLYIAKVLKSHGYRVEILDCTFLNSIEEAKEIIKDKMPAVVGITTMITLTKYVSEFIRYSKSLNIPVVCGGPDASIRPDKYIKLGADYVVVGEGEETIVELMPLILKKEEPVEVKGVVYKNNKGNVVYNPKRNFIRNIDEIGAPDRSFINNNLYRETWMKSHGFAMTTVITSRGCPYSCNYCSNPVAPFGRRYTYRSTKNVVEELEEVVTKLGFNRIWFADDVFTINRIRTIELCKEIINRGLNFKWSCLTRADRVDEEILNLMKKAGCEIIFYGLESASQRMLNLMNRNMKVEDMRRGMLLTKKVGIKIHTFVMVGYPGETFDSLIETIKFMKEIMPEEFSFTLAYPLPGTKLHDLVDIQREDEWEFPNENKLMFQSDMSQAALRFFIRKTKLEISLHKYSNKRVFQFAEKLFNKATNLILKGLSVKAGKYDWYSRCVLINSYINIVRQSN